MGKDVACQSLESRELKYRGNGVEEVLSNAQYCHFSVIAAERPPPPTPDYRLGLPTMWGPWG